MATVFFFGSRMCSSLEFMPHKTAITGDWLPMLPQSSLYARISNKCRGKLSAGVLLLHDNAPKQKSGTSQAAIRKCGFVELNHPPYSPDLAPSDTFSSETLKKFSVDDDFLMTIHSRKLKQGTLTPKIFHLF